MTNEVMKTVLNLCQMALSARRADQDTPLSKVQIRETATELASLPSFAAGVDLDLLVAKLEEVFTSWANDPRALGSDIDHVPWLHIAKGEMDWRFWIRYQLYLVARQNIDDAGTRNIEKVVDEILGRLEDPGRDGPWDRRGLVMGNVQSGKTAAYTGLVCKAADAGYKVIIVLAGLHNNLRSQTQIRLDEGFLGYRAMPPGMGEGGFEPVGVHDFGPGVHADSVTNRNENGDFNRAVARHFAIHPGGNPLLFVVKKHVTILKNLLAWIHHSADATDPENNRRYHRNVPLLLIDDEADQASIDTNQMAFDENGMPDPEHDPTKTNRLIRSLLHSFDKSAYVGFTATPFANVFIHEKAATREYGEDLFPRSFIINLTAPSTYTGAARIFGIEEDIEAGLEPVEALPLTRTVTDHADSLTSTETRGWMPPRLVAKTGHVPLFNGHRQIPDSLRTAVMSFILSAAVRAIREPGPLINTMLVHVVRFTNVQSIVCSEIEDALRGIVNRLELGDGERRPTVVDEFQSIWTEDYIPTSAKCGAEFVLPDWDAVKGLLRKIATGVKVKAINGTAEDCLDYEQHRKSGLNVITVGGDKLSRGLTLEGLTVSYFLRTSRMYDTLMQMGRWFGYRGKYIDVCRLYTTKELETWFRHIARASEELKAEFDYMLKIGATPKEYGLRVKSHPVLTVTSAVKMRHGVELRISYSGQISETLNFELGSVETNFRAAVRLLDDLRTPVCGGRTSGYLWKNVPVSSIQEFLSTYKSASGAPRASSAMWNRYIAKQVERGELQDWAVFLASSSDPLSDNLKNFFPGQLDVGSIKRKAEDEGSDDYVIGRLVSPSDEMRDLEPSEYELARQKSVELWAIDTRINKAAEPPSEPTGRGTRLARPKSRGLLLLYPLDRRVISDDRCPKTPIIGVAISFPCSDTAQDISYVVASKFAEDFAFGEI